MTISHTIEMLRKIVSDKNCERMNKSTVIGFLGELIVKEQLEKADIAVEHCGNQTGYDLTIQSGSIKIDVKTSRSKDEYSWYCDHWGWELVHSNKQKPISATHFICVAFDDDLNVDRFILIPASIATRFPGGIRQFKKVKNSLCVFPGRKRPVKQLTSEESRYINKCEELTKDKSIRVIGKGKLISLADFN